MNDFKHNNFPIKKITNHNNVFCFTTFYNSMGKKYIPVNKFECCGRTMVTVIIKGKAACTMSELEYNRMIEDELEFKKCNRYGVA